jgi:5-methylthioadenosine/S-adenosylhomocysteine deaminase
MRQGRNGKLLIRGAVLGTGPAAGSQTDILMSSGKIVDVRPNIDAADACLIEGTNAIAIPGFVDGHRHLWQLNLRGLLADAVIADYYRNVRVGYATAYTPDDVYTSVYAGAVDALRDGVTSVLDHCHIMNSPDHADAAARALRDSGIRAVFCYGFYAPPVKDPVFRVRQDRYRDIERMRRDTFPSDDGLVTLGAALTEQWLVPQQVTADEVQVAKRLGLKNVTLHVGSNPATTDIERFRSTECCGPAFTYSHCNTCQEAFFKFVAETGGAIVATPETELGMGIGFPVTNQAVAGDIRFGLGVDIVSYGNGDMIANAGLALQTARAVHCWPEVRAGRMPQSAGYTTKDALHWATTGGAEAMGLGSKTGTMEPGKRADLVLVKTDRLNMSPLCDPATAIVMHARASDVDMVIVDGEIRVSGGEPVGVEMRQLMAKLERSKHGILERVARARAEHSDMSRAYEALITGKA